MSNKQVVVFVFCIFVYLAASTEKSMSIAAKLVALSCSFAALAWLFATHAFFRRVALREHTWWILCLLAIAVSTCAAYYFVSPIKSEFFASKQLLQTALAVLFIANTAAIEEVVFRSLLLERLRRKLGNTLSILISATLFSALHFDAAVMALLAGLYFGVLRVVFESLIPAIVFHAILNSLSAITERIVSASRLAATPDDQGAVLASLIVAISSVILAYASTTLHILFAQLAKRKRASG